jgi:nucleotide-binding universal stress UspA family protein
MYKHILLPTDGSPLSRKAVDSGLQLAKCLGASVLGIHVLPQLHQDQLDAWLHHDPHHAERWHAVLDKFASDYLQAVTESAHAYGVPCVCHKIESSQPAFAIVHAASVYHCDLICIASHGWTQGKGSMLGSVTLRVLHDSSVPVLVQNVFG